MNGLVSELNVVILVLNRYIIEGYAQHVTTSASQQRNPRT